MIKVFISYSDAHNREDAENLAEVLDSTGRIESILASRVPSHAEGNAEKIARLIDGSHFFISFYTSDGKDNHWVNQELGYAFNHVSQYGLKIIPIYENRDDFKGFLTSQSHNFYSGFLLGDDRMKCFEEIKKYLVDEYKHPIILDVAERQANSLTLLLTNLSPKIISQGRIDIVVPKGIEPINHGTTLAQTRLCPAGHIPNELYVESSFKERMEETQSNSIPEPLRYKFDRVDNIEIKRVTLFLKDIYGSNDYELGWVFKWDKSPKKYKEFDFGVYLTIPLFGTTFYQGTISFSSLNGAKLENKDAPAAKVRIRLGAK